MTTKKLENKLAELVADGYDASAFDVIEIAMKYKNKWRDKPYSYWFAALAEEFGELGASLNGEHEHSPDFELKQIASICINWLDMINQNIDAH